jgi:hypothetical protein
MNNLSELYESQGKYAEAESLFVECLRVRKEVLGNTHLAIMVSMSNLAGLYKSQGKYAEAEQLHGDA